MITGNPLTEPPHTPFPDALASSDSEPSHGPFPPTPPLNAGQPLVVPETTTADDISLILTTSIEKPEPDPMLGSGYPSSTSPPESIPGGDHEPLATFSMPASASTSDPLGLDIGIQLAPSSDSVARQRAAAEVSGDEIEGHAGDDSKPPYSLPMLLLVSYASAVTLALVWVLWTGRGLSKPTADRGGSVSSSLPAIDWAKVSAPKRAPVSSLAADRVTGLGKPLVIGDLEVTPIVVLFQNVRVYRIVDPDAERRENPACLVLTLRLRNKSSDRRLTPLELASVRDAVDPTEASFIETASGERIAMFKLAMESEWSIENQSFPAVEPGGAEDVILVSEPVEEPRLASPLVWRIKLKTGVGRSEEIGVRFARQEIGDSDR
ncbi:MAG: hypothetical protein P4L85_22055 [Paludisphaera borealis]|uniref:hypothetical protein n=1 Tax=Paludisphaera borealis TaxID=1387353 RepID=UPI002847B459|nr:hypothetical protein [Paludisphaera borealis]MDR3622049.1 hypothetical protein [Paludisphaera borealis]